ncbi:hypothetical protein [Gemella haemolysans]|uniref:hypothetical protein n=1 Tax=Gemella haemolysans TaxID=1379 RepID=UPI0028D61AE8|nr:hypothetical protein [Gemella haemolysans]
MGPKFYIEDVNEWDSKYSIDYIKFDEFGVIDIVRLTDERDYLVHGNIQLPIFDSENEYIDYLEKEDIIDPFLAKQLRRLAGYKPEMIILDDIILNNALFVGDPRGEKRGTGFKNAFQLQMEATLLWEFAAIEALERTIQVIRTLIRDKEHKLSDGPIRIRKAS